MTHSPTATYLISDTTTTVKSFNRHVNDTNLWTVKTAATRKYIFKTTATTMKTTTASTIPWWVTRRRKTTTARPTASPWRGLKKKKTLATVTTTASTTTVPSTTHHIRESMYTLRMRSSGVTRAMILPTTAKVRAKANVVSSNPRIQKNICTANMVQNTVLHTTTPIAPSLLSIATTSSTVSTSAKTTTAEFRYEKEIINPIGDMSEDDDF